jgi:hypothetical protein
MVRDEKVWWKATPKLGVCQEEEIETTMSAVKIILTNSIVWVEVEVTNPRGSVAKNAEVSRDW